MSILESLVSENWDTVRRNFERLDRLFSLASKDSDGFGFTVAGISVRFGVKSVTHTASNQGTAIVTHGLGKTPAAVVVTGAQIGVDGTAYTGAVNTVGAASFTLLSTRSGAAFTGAVPFYWIAVG